METLALDWLLTLLAVHAACLVGAGHLYRGAPCWMQRWAMGLLVFSFIFFCAGYLAGVFRVEWWWGLLIVGAALEHLGVMFYLLRMARDKWTWRGEHGRIDRPVAEVR